MSIKHQVKTMALKMGVELRRYNAVESPTARLAHQMTMHGIDLALDVGANDGGYGRLLRSLHYAGDILSFEPLSSAHTALQRATEKDPHWFVASRMALGETDGEIQINIAGNSASSSILPMADLHRAAAPVSAYVGSEEVPLHRLDTIDHPAIARAGAMLLKIDTQGYEMPVLRGAIALLPKVKGIQLELSTAVLYEGQTTYMDVIQWLQSHGYALWNLLPGFTDPESGRMLQFDGIFFRP
jgi:FkbM family methyltransferase